jgi:hypothetical protein
MIGSTNATIPYTQPFTEHKQKREPHTMALTLEIRNKKFCIEYQP